MAQSEEGPVGAEPDYSRAALARFIEFVVEKGLVQPATAQGWRVSTSKVLEELSPDEADDVRRIDLPATFKAFLNRNPGRLSPASVGEYRRRVGRAIEQFVRWVEDPGAYSFRPVTRARAELRPRPEPGVAARSEAQRSGAERSERVRSSLATALATHPAEGPSGIALDYPLRPDLLAQVVVPRDLTVEEARRMGAFLITLAVDFKPAMSA
jgi:hypothetical protein